MIFSNGDISGSQTLTDLDHLYPAHINELRTAISSGIVVTVGMANADYICTGTADDIQIQAAIDSLSATAGGVVWIKQGTYDITTSIIVTNPNVHIIGEGFGTILRLANSINLPVIRLESTADYAMIEDLKIDGNQDNNTIPGGNGNQGILTSASDGVFQNLTFIECKSAGIWLFQASINKILNCNFDSNWMAVRINNSSNNNLVQGCSITNNSWGVSVYDGGVGQVCTRNQILDNYIYNCTGQEHALSLAGISVLASPYTLVSGNTISDNYGRGIECFAGSYSSIISNNHVTGCGLPTVEVDGINVGMAGIDTGPDSHLTIANNYVGGNGDAGIWVSGNFYNIIQGNYCINNGQNADSRTNGSANGITMNIDTTCSYNLVIGNYCIDTQLTPTQQYGITEWQGVAGDYLYNNFVGNFTKGNALGGINLVSVTSTKYGNAEI